jgi:arylsulfatase A-like enzyme
VISVVGTMADGGTVLDRWRAGAARSHPDPGIDGSEHAGHGMAILCISSIAGAAFVQPGGGMTLETRGRCVIDRTRRPAPVRSPTPPHMGCMHPGRSSLLLLLLCVLVEGGEARPNVLFIVVDDLNDWVGCLQGHPQASTPNLDRLAARGVLFANAHCQAPLCNPSRTSVLFGRRPSTTGVHGLAPAPRQVATLREAVSLPQCFAAAGYHTATSGKIHHDSAAMPLAEEFAVVGAGGPAPYPASKLVTTPDPMRAVDWGPFEADESRHGDRQIADAAIAHLAQAPSDRPFLIAAGFRYPHLPCFAPPSWFDRLPVDVTLPPVRSDDRSDVPAIAWFLHWDLPEPRLGWLQAQQQWQPLVRAYLASTSFMDAQLGRLLDALDAHPRGRDTLVVLWSDHGWHLGEKGITGKNTLWERSTRVPLIIAGPGIGPGVCREPVELLDLYPTLVARCGLDAPAGLEGLDLSPQLADVGAARARPALTTHNRGHHAVRSARWRYIRYADGSQELYDHQADPHEWTNLAHDPANAVVIAELARHLPEIDVPAAPGSAHRVLERRDGVWWWEGCPIVPGAVAP